jgi:hypothetical protein
LHTQGIGLALGVVEVRANQGLGKIAGASAKREKLIRLRHRFSARLLREMDAQSA